MPFLELFDETLDINSTGNYELSIQMNPEGFAFSILDTLRNKYVLLRSFDLDDNKYLSSDKITELVSKDDFLSKTYKKVNIVIPSQKSTLVPLPLYDPGRKEDYFLLNHLRESNEVILANRIKDPDSYLVFALSRPFADTVENLFAGIHPVHHLKPLLHQVSHNSKGFDGQYIHLHVEREFFNIIISEKGDLKFCNTFIHRNISDIMYYVLKILKNMGSGNEATIHLSGLTERFDVLSSSLNLYVKNIKFTSPSGNYTFSYVFNEIATHRYINLFTVTNCE